MFATAVSGQQEKRGSIMNKKQSWWLFGLSILISLFAGYGSSHGD
jgi:hypothetical protein